MAESLSIVVKNAQMNPEVRKTKKSALFAVAHIEAVRVKLAVENVDTNWRS